VNLAQIRSAILEIFHTQTKNYRPTAPKTDLPQFTACSNKIGLSVMNAKTNDAMNHIKHHLKKSLVSTSVLKSVLHQSLQLQFLNEVNLNHSVSNQTYTCSARGEAALLKLELLTSARNQLNFSGNV